MHYGLTERLASIRGLGVTSEEAMRLYSNPKKLINLLTEKAKIFIKDDGAEVIIPGCTILSTVLSANNCCEINGVPIIDPIAASIKMAEVLVDLRKSCKYQVSRTGLYGREKDAPLSLPLKYGAISKD
jgi:Asp/Glu/hydantoin racemase